MLRQSEMKYEIMLNDEPPSAESISYWGGAEDKYK